jgi:hypothetical protein
MFPIQALRFRSAAPLTQVSLVSASILSEVTKPSVASCFYDINSDGSASYGGNAADSSGNWTWLLYGLNTDYQIQATLVSGSTPSGSPVGSWLSLGTSRSWTISRSLTGSTGCSLNIQVRRVVDQVIIASSSVSMTAQVDFA